MGSRDPDPDLVRIRSSNLNADPRFRNADSPASALQYGSVLASGLFVSLRIRVARSGIVVALVKLTAVLVVYRFCHEINVTYPFITFFLIADLGVSVKADT
jgi:hypothetical protein